MTKKTFDRHVVALYGQLSAIIEKRYGYEGHDALQDSFVSLYRSKAYASLHPKLKPEKVIGWLVQAVLFCVRSQRRNEAIHRHRYKLLSELEYNRLSQDVFQHGTGEQKPWEGLDERPIELIKDVQKAIGSLSAYHQNLVRAYFFEERTLREIASDTEETFYRVFTEVEIAKSYLRESLKDYRPRKWKGP